MTHLLIERSLLIVLALSVIPLLTSALASGLAVMVQTVVQVQEQTIVHLIRVGVGFAMVGLLMPWAQELLLDLVEQAFLAIERMGQQQ